MYIFVLRTEKLATFEPKMVGFSARNTVHKIRKLRRAIFSVIPQHFATKLCNFIILEMLFSAIVKEFVHVAWIKIYSTMRIVNYRGLAL